jgi:hypothetical protein
LQLQADDGVRVDTKITVYQQDQADALQAAFVQPSTMTALKRGLTTTLKAVVRRHAP